MANTRDEALALLASAGELGALRLALGAPAAPEPVQHQVSGTVEASSAFGLIEEPVAQPEPEPEHTRRRSRRKTEEETKDGAEWALARVVLRRQKKFTDIFQQSRVEGETSFYYKHEEDLSRVELLARHISTANRSPRGVRGVGATLALWDALQADRERTERFASILSFEVDDTTPEEDEALAPLFEWMQDAQRGIAGQRSKEQTKEVLSHFNNAWSRYLRATADAS